MLDALRHFDRQRYELLAWAVRLRRKASAAAPMHGQRCPCHYPKKAKLHEGASPLMP